MARLILNVDETTFQDASLASFLNIEEDHVNEQMAQGCLLAVEPVNDDTEFELSTLRVTDEGDQLFISMKMSLEEAKHLHMFLGQFLQS